MTTITNTTPVDPLDMLADEAADLTSTITGDDAQPGAAPEAQAPSLTNAQCLAMGWEIIRDTLCAVAKVSTPKTTLSAEAIGPMAEAQAAVLDKYGIDLASMSGNYMVEIKAAIVTLPVLLAFRVGLQGELAAANKADKADKPAPAPPPPVHKPEYPSATLVS